MSGKFFKKNPRNSALCLFDLVAFGSPEKEMSWWVMGQVG